MEDHWRSSNDAFRSGAYNEASRHSAEALRSTAHSNTLLRAVHQINLNATRWAQSNDASFSSSVASSYAIVPFPPDNSPLSLRLFAHRTALVAAYNHALRMAKSLKHRTKAAVSPITKSLGTSVDYVLTAIQFLLPSSPFSTYDLLSTTEADKATIASKCSRLNDLIEHGINNVGSLNVDQESVTEAHDWARVASRTFDLISYLHIYKKDFHTATVVSVTSRALHTLSDTFHSLDQMYRALETADRVDFDNDDITRNTDGARSIYLQALSLAMGGDDEAALRVILPKARACLELTGISEDDAEKRILYLASVLLARKRGRNQEGRQFAEACIARLYRKVDSLSLAARMSESDGELERWRAVLDINIRRPAALWLASKAMGRVGKYIPQSALLKTLEDHLLEINEGDDEACLSLRNSIQLPCQQSNIDVRMIRAERGRALCAAGDRKNGGELLRKCDLNGTVEEATALATVSPKDVLHSDTSGMDIEIRPQWELVGLSLASAEAALRTGDVNGASEAANDALRKSIGMETSDCSAERLIRAVCVHNVGALKVCKGAAAAADEWFAAAQTAFEKCAEGDDVLANDARSLATLSTMARCVTLWASGRREDAATHWVEKRGLQALSDVSLTQSEPVGDVPVKASNRDISDSEDTKPVGLVFKIDEETLARMDAICVKKCRQTRERDFEAH